MGRAARSDIGHLKDMPELAHLGARAVTPVNLPAPLHQSSADLLLPLWRENHHSHARTWRRFPIVRALLFWVHVDNHGLRLRYGFNDLGANPDAVDVENAC